MKLIFDHLAGRMTQSDVVYSTIEALFDPEEAMTAAETGWLINEWEPPKWFQGRQVRLDLAARHKIRRNPRLDAIVLKPSKAVIARMQPIWDAYVAHHGYDDHLPVEASVAYEPDKKVVILYQIDRQDVGYSLLRIDPMAVALQFAWDYAEPKLSLGKIAQWWEIETARVHRCRHLYLCPGYERCCLYKANNPGFEFWTGTSWSTDKERYRALCERDSTLDFLDNLKDLEE